MQVIVSSASCFVSPRRQTLTNGTSSRCTLAVAHDSGRGVESTASVGVTTIVEPSVTATGQSAKRKATPVVLAVLHPNGVVGRSTTVWQLGAELALRGKRVRIEDLDQGAHLSRTFGQYPLGLARAAARQRRHDE